MVVAFNPKRGMMMMDLMAENARLKSALAALTDAFLEKHGCFPLYNPSWKAAMAEAYQLIGQPNSVDRTAALAAIQTPDAAPTA